MAVSFLLYLFKIVFEIIEKNLIINSLISGSYFHYFLLLITVLLHLYAPKYVLLFQNLILNFIRRL